MIKRYNPRPFEKPIALPTYSTVTEQYELIAKVKGGYVISLARLTSASSRVNDYSRNYALFESFDDRGNRRVMAATKEPADIKDSEFKAVIKSMMNAGVEFGPVSPCRSEELLAALGAWIQAQNPEIEEYQVVSLC